MLVKQRVGSHGKVITRKKKENVGKGLNGWGKQE
jgi:hypothetical protein